MKTHTPCPTLVGFNRKGEAKIIWCGKWSCPHCQKRLARKWSVRTRLHVQACSLDGDEHWWFITFTLGSKYKSVTGAYKGLKYLWDKLRKIFRLEHGKGWQYIAFVEGQPHRDNMPHFHIICNRIPKSYVNNQGEVVKHRVHNFAVTIGFGHQSYCEPVNNEGAAAYVSKYAGKHGEEMPKSFRRVRTSQHFTPYPVDPNARLIVRKKNEEIYCFIDRVNAVSGVAHEELYNRYTREMLIMGDLQDL